MLFSVSSAFIHLKCSMLGKMPGYTVDKFANLRTGYAFMMGHSGKKLLFMGQEFGQEREWSEAREIDWFSLEDPLHKGMQTWFGDLLRLYNKYPCMYELDSGFDGFRWINADDTEKSIYSFYRQDHTEKNNLLFVMNFTPMERGDYRVGVPREGKYSLLLNSDETKYGGNGAEIPKSLKAEEIPWDGQPYSVAYPLAPYGAAIFLY